MDNTVIYHSSPFSDYLLKILSYKNSLFNVLEYMLPRFYSQIPSFVTILITNFQKYPKYKESFPFLMYYYDINQK